MGVITAIFIALFLSIAVPSLCQNEETSDSGSPVNIYNMRFWSDVRFRMTSTLLSARMRSRSTRTEQVNIFVTLQDQDYITNFAVHVNRMVRSGWVVPRKSRHRPFRASRRVGQTTATLTQQGRNSNEYVIRFTIPAGGEVQFYLTYQGLLRRRYGVYEHAINVNPGQVVDDLTGAVRLRETRAITFLRVPQMRRMDQAYKRTPSGENPDATIDRRAHNIVIISYSSPTTSQRRHSRHGLASQFIVQYDIDHALHIGDFQAIAGYFVHYVAPLGLPVMSKDVVFVVDVSEAARGDTLAHTQAALVRILTRLHSADRFSLIICNQNVTIWPETRHAEVSEVTEAAGVVGDIRAGGGADLHTALTSAMTRLLTSNPPRPLMVVLLTASPPTRSAAILRDVREINTAGHVSVFSVVLIPCVNFNFLLRLSSQNKGFIRRVHAGPDAADQIVDIYDEIASPVLTGVRVNYPGDKVKRKVMDNPGTLFEGGEILVAGELRNSVEDVTVDIIAESANGSYHHVANITMDDAQRSALQIHHMEGSTERIFMYLEIRSLLDDVMTSPVREVRKAARPRILTLSKENHFVTPLNSLKIAQMRRTSRSRVVTVNRVIRHIEAECSDDQLERL